jgi:hypothetical protein
MPGAEPQGHPLQSVPANPGPTAGQTFRLRSGADADIGNVTTIRRSDGWARLLWAPRRGATSLPIVPWLDHVVAVAVLAVVALRLPMIANPAGLDEAATSWSGDSGTPEVRRSTATTGSSGRRC